MIQDIIERNKVQVQKEYKMGGLSDGLYGDYATEVSKRSTKEILAWILEMERAKLIDERKAVECGDYLVETYDEKTAFNLAKQDTINYLEEFIKELK